MAKVLRYTSGGRTFDMNEGSAAHKLAAADGQFEFVGEVLEDGTIAVETVKAVETVSEVDEVVDLSKLNRDGLIARAAEVGVVIDAADKAQTKAVIIKAIEAKLAETPAE